MQNVIPFSQLHLKLTPLTVLFGSPLSSPFHLLDKDGSIIEHPSDTSACIFSFFFSVITGSGIESSESSNKTISALNSTIQS